MKRTIFSAMALLLSSVAGCGTTNTGACATVTCATDQFCDGATGACKAASACAGVTCSAGTVCDGTEGSSTVGKCVSTTCGATQCTNGQVCNSATATCTNPGVPALGIQIDRMGRPAVNTALTNPYGISPANETTDITRSFYNTDADPTAWAARWAAQISANLGILDGLDGTCGNSFAYNANYATLTTVLVNDVLLVDTTKTTCSQYLAVEAGVTTDCGGRTLREDVIDVTYSVVATPGAATAAATDNIGEGTVPLTTFPFFAAPI